MTEDFFDTEWNHLDIKRENHNNSKKTIEKPDKLEEMLLVAQRLSQGIPFLRTNLYLINQKNYFGELTLFPANGFSKFIPETYDYFMGKWLNIMPILQEKGSIL